LAQKICGIVMIRLTLTILAFAMIFPIPGCAVFEDQIMVVEMKNVSLNLSSDYEISKNSSVAMAAQTISINSTAPGGGNASLMLMSFYTEGDESQQLNQSAFLDLMEAIFLGAVELAGGQQVGNITVNSPQGGEVALKTFSLPGSGNQSANEANFAFWDLNQYMHVILTSELDQNQSARIIETLEIRP